MRRSLTLLVSCVALAACAGKPTPTPTRTLGTGEHWLPVANWGDNIAVRRRRLPRRAPAPRLA